MKRIHSPWFWVLLWALMVWGAGMAHAADIYVDAAGSMSGDGSVGNPCKLIQQGLSRAGSGDTVWVRTGTYTEDIVMKDGVTLRSVDDVRPVIRGTGVQVVVQASGLGGGTAIRNFYIENGKGASAGGVDMRESSMEVSRCVFYNNSGAKGGAILISGDSAAPLISHCRFLENNSTDHGGAVAVESGADPVFEDCRFLFNRAGFGGGVSLVQAGFCATPLQASFDGCSFEHNSAMKGGGVFNCINSGATYWVKATYTNCEFIGNKATLDGGGFWANGGGGVQAFIYNTLFTRNEADGAGNAMYCITSATNVYNSVFYDNTADDGGVGIYVLYDRPGFSIRNSILYHNGTRELSGSEPGEIFASHNLVEGGWGDGTNHTIDADPLFVDPDFLDFSIQEGSPCVDAGYDYSGMPATDANGNPRVMDGDADGVPVVDMGLYEVRLPDRVYVDDDWAGSRPGDRVGFSLTYGVDAFSRIQDGIDAVPGPGRVIVHSGSYFEHPVLKTNVVLEGRRMAPDNGFVVITGAGENGHLVTITDCTTGETGLTGFHLVLGHETKAGVMVMDSTNVLIRGCEISGNGTGVHMAASSGIINQCGIFGNGVGIRNEASDTGITGCDIHGNRIRGMENSQASPTISDTMIRNHNGEEADSGAAMRNVDSSPFILDCLFDGNRIGTEASPFGQGGAIYNDNAFPMILRCDFTSNLAQQGGAVYSFNYSRPVFNHCTFEGNHAERGGASYAYQVSPAFDACGFTGNTARYGGGTYSTETGSFPRFENCTFTENSSSGSGGAVFAGNLSAPKIVNCVIYGNTAATGGAGNGGGIYETFSQPVVINSIIRANSPTQIYDSSGEATVSFSNIEGGYPGAGNIVSDPLFVDAAAHDFGLATSSPCIDTGVALGGAVQDAMGNPRPLGSSSDMGIYEYAGGAILTVVPDTADFGDVVLGGTGNMKVVAKNTGIRDLTITAFTFAAKNHFTLAPKLLPITLSTGQETVLMLSFEPGSVLGVITNELRISSNNLEGQVVVPLVGVGVPEPHVIAASATAGGAISPSGTVSVPDGEDQSFILTAHEGYSLSLVRVDGASVGAADSYTFTSVTADHTIEAVFSAITRSITATAGPHGSVHPDGDVSVNWGGDQAFTFTPDSGYAVDDVLVDGVSVGAVTSFTFSHVTENHTLSVTFDTPHYEIQASAGVGGTISPSGVVQVAALAGQTFTITPVSWMEIADVLVDEVSVGAVATYTFSSVTDDHTIQAFFEDTVPDVWVDDDYADGEDNDGHTWGVNAFASVQAGIDAVTAPAMVHVAAGTYTELITLKSGIHVLGAGPDVAILDGAGLSGNVVTAGNVDETAVFEGFTVRNGVRTTVNSEGTGMNLIDSSPVLSNCIFESNEVVALKNDNASPRIKDCVFRNNDAGGMQNWGGSNPVLENCLFENNGTFGMENRNSSPVITQCDFIGNYVLESVPSPQGGGMVNWDSNPVITGCRFEDNVLDIGGVILSAGGGGAIYNLRSSPSITDCVFTGNGGASGGAIYNLISSPVITGCTFTSNRGGISDDSQGGAIYNASGSAPTITGCVFTGNAGFRGGAMYISLSDGGVPPVTVTNCIFDNNTSIRHGAAVFAQFDGGALHLVNSVFYGNRVDSNGDGNGEGAVVYNDRGDVLLVNAIAWGNTGSVIYNENTAIVVRAQYSDVEGGYGGLADMNIDDDPLFVDAPAKNFRLQSGSPCIDAGTSTGTVAIPDADLDGTPRPIGASHDMGAYEYATGALIRVTPSQLDFVDTAQGGISSLDLVIENTGDLDLTLTGVIMTDTTHFGMAAIAVPYTVPSGESRTWTIEYAPEWTGNHTADLIITSDAGETVVPLSGTCTAPSHTITASAGTGGTISPSGDVTVPDGGDQAFTITAGADYNIASVQVDGMNVGSVASYTFTRVTADHSIQALFELQAGISVGAVSGQTCEDGTTATFTVVLTHEPSADVFIPVFSGDLDEGSVSTDTLIFTPADWGTARTVTVTGVDDAVDDGDKAYTVHLGVAVSDDASFDGVDPSDPSLVNADDDTAGIQVGAVSGNTDETGATATFTLALLSEPLYDVEIAVASDDPGEGEVSPDTVVFTPADWSTPQTVTVTGVDDDAEDGAVTYAIVLTSVSSDPNYDDADIPDVMITNTDDDRVGTPDDEGGGGGGGGCFIGTLN